jgi:hypothetical protein
VGEHRTELRGIRVSRPDSSGDDNYKSRDHERRKSENQWSQQAPGVHLPAIMLFLLHAVPPTFGQADSAGYPIGEL